MNIRKVSDEDMCHNIALLCPMCTSKNSKFSLYKLDDETICLCENPNCLYPLGCYDSSIQSVSELDDCNTGKYLNTSNLYDMVLSFMIGKSTCSNKHIAIETIWNAIDIVRVSIREACLDLEDKTILEVSFKKIIMKLQNSSWLLKYSKKYGELVSNIQINNKEYNSEIEALAVHCLPDVINVNTVEHYSKYIIDHNTAIDDNTFIKILAYLVEVLTLQEIRYSIFRSIIYEKYASFRNFIANIDTCGNCSEDEQENLVNDDIFYTDQCDTKKKLVVYPNLKRDEECCISISKNGVQAYDSECDVMKCSIANESNDTINKVDSMNSNTICNLTSLNKQSRELVLINKQKHTNISPIPIEITGNICFKSEYSVDRSSHKQSKGNKKCLEKNCHKNVNEIVDNENDYIVDSNINTIDSELHQSHDYATLQTKKSIYTNEYDCTLTEISENICLKSGYLSNSEQVKKTDRKQQTESEECLGGISDISSECAFDCENNVADNFELIPFETNNLPLSSKNSKVSNQPRKSERLSKRRKINALLKTESSNNNEYALPKDYLRKRGGKRKQKGDDLGKTDDDSLEGIFNNIDDDHANSSALRENLVNTLAIKRPKRKSNQTRSKKAKNINKTSIQIKRKKTSECCDNNKNILSKTHLEKPNGKRKQKENKNLTEPIHVNTKPKTRSKKENYKWQKQWQKECEKFIETNCDDDSKNDHTKIECSNSSKPESQSEQSNYEWEDEWQKECNKFLFKTELEVPTNDHLELIFSKNKKPKSKKSDIEWKQEWQNKCKEFSKTSDDEDLGNLNSPLIDQPVCCTPIESSPIDNNANTSHKITLSPGKKISNPGCEAVFTITLAQGTDTIPIFIQKNDSEGADIDEIQDPIVNQSNVEHEVNINKITKDNVKSTSLENENFEEDGGSNIIEKMQLEPYIFGDEPLKRKKRVTKLSSSEKEPIGKSSNSTKRQRSSTLGKLMQSVEIEDAVGSTNKNCQMITERDLRVNDLNKPLSKKKRMTDLSSSLDSLVEKPLNAKLEMEKKGEQTRCKSVGKLVQFVEIEDPAESTNKDSQILKETKPELQVNDKLLSTSQTRKKKRATETSSVKELTEKSLNTKLEKKKRRERNRCKTVGKLMQFIEIEDMTESTMNDCQETEPDLKANSCDKLSSSSQTPKKGVTEISSSEKFLNAKLETKKTSEQKISEMQNNITDFGLADDWLMSLL